MLTVPAQNRRRFDKDGNLILTSLDHFKIEGYDFDIIDKFKKLNWKAKYTIKTMIKEMVEIEFKNLNKVDS